MKTVRIKTKIWKRMTDPYKLSQWPKRKSWVTIWPEPWKCLFLNTKPYFHRRENYGSGWKVGEEASFKIEVSLTSQPRSTATPCLEPLGRLLHLVIGVQNCSWPRRWGPKLHRAGRVTWVSRPQLPHHLGLSSWRQCCSHGAPSWDIIARNYEISEHPSIPGPLQHL